MERSDITDMIRDMTITKKEIEQKLKARRNVRKKTYKSMMMLVLGSAICYSAYFGIDRYLDHKTQVDTFFKNQYHNVIEYIQESHIGQKLF